MDTAEKVDQYLLRLGLALSRKFPDDESTVLRVLSETEDHLRQSVCFGRQPTVVELSQSQAVVFGPTDHVLQRSPVILQLDEVGRQAIDSRGADLRLARQQNPVSGEHSQMTTDAR